MAIATLPTAPLGPAATSWCASFTNPNCGVIFNIKLDDELTQLSCCAAVLSNRCAPLTSSKVAFERNEDPVDALEAGNMPDGWRLACDWLMRAIMLAQALLDAEKTGNTWREQGLQPAPHFMDSDGSVKV